MANRSIIFTVGLVLLTGHICNAQANLESCLQISNCFKFFEGATCDASGRRQVCLSWVDFAGCSALDPNGAAAVSTVNGICKMNNFGTETSVPAGKEICDNVLGGTVYDFGIQSMSQSITVSAGPIAINGYVNNNGMAQCDGFTSVCSSGGNNDFRLTFHVSPCPTTTTPTTTTPTTTTVTVPTPPQCFCSQWGQWGGCSAPCGSTAQRTRTRTCSNCGNSTPPLSFNGPCPNVPFNCPRHGGWSNWGPFAGCTATCGAGTNTRTRTCTMPPPQFGGSSCPGSDREVVPCVLTPTCGPTTLRECKRLAKANECSGLRKKRLRKCLKRECPKSLFR